MISQNKCGGRNFCVGNEINSWDFKPNCVLSKSTTQTNKETIRKQSRTILEINSGKFQHKIKSFSFYYKKFFGAFEIVCIIRE